MITLAAEFYQGEQGKLFRLIRTPEEIHGHILFVAPLFEEANLTRHMITKVANQAYNLGYHSVVYDHFGTGDSEGDLRQSDLRIWQQDIINQLRALKQHTSLPVTLSVSLSAGLLLCADIINEVDYVQCWQVELNGARFVRQLKRIALAADMDNDTAVAKSVVNPQGDKQKVDSQEVTVIAGYEIPNTLLQQLVKQNITIDHLEGQQTLYQSVCHWFEWLSAEQDISSARAKQLSQCQQVFSTKIKFYTINEGKFWQATELINSPQLLAETKQIFHGQLESTYLNGQGMNQEHIPSIQQAENSIVKPIVKSISQENSGTHDA
ncbi:hypothetical protein [Litorilituus lipolyticus]|uniref:Serine aminopeptidase S33 domain-containing protein n=1 Tax=Litorilituus lipolyticus TaxID=2491017 RepID=A0A502KZF7_9GAMM|nr:hypothetical protein [Litorilituus lipolyticus]TPH15555.1 hypothetical protein EPA86_08215 [Litorilituus lipolyticus]